MKRSITVNNILANENVEIYNGKVIKPRLRTSYFELNGVNKNILKHQILAKFLQTKS